MKRTSLIGWVILFASGIAVLWWYAGTSSSPVASTPTHTPLQNLPKIDVHVHVHPSLAKLAVEILQSQGIVIAINASGGTPGGSLEKSIEAAGPTHGRLLSYCTPHIDVENPSWPVEVVHAVERCKKLGAVGLKFFKSLGLGIELNDGSLLKIDDPRLDPLFEAAGAQSLPILIHTGDPQAFFRAPNPDNERFAELKAHPEWSFYGLRPGTHMQWPSWTDLFHQFERRVARHPNTQFLGAHFGNAPEEPERVAHMLQQYPNYFIETGARIPEIGRHPASTMHDFFVKYQDRILFGTDFSIGPWGVTLGSSGEEPDRLEEIPRFFGAHWKYFETRTKRMAHPTPIQGNWTIDGIGLERQVLQKIYSGNTQRLFRLSTQILTPSP